MDNPKQEPEQGLQPEALILPWATWPEAPSPVPRQRTAASLTCPGPARAQAAEAGQSFEFPKVGGQGPDIHLLGFAQGSGVPKRPELLAGLKKTPKREGGPGEALGGFDRHTVHKI